jgi:hypothetical protein
VHQLDRVRNVRLAVVHKATAATVVQALRGGEGDGFHLLQLLERLQQPTGDLLLFVGEAQHPRAFDHRHGLSGHAQLQPVLAARRPTPGQEGIASRHGFSTLQRIQHVVVDVQVAHLAGGGVALHQRTEHFNTRGDAGDGLRRARVHRQGAAQFLLGAADGIQQIPDHQPADDGERDQRARQCLELHGARVFGRQCTRRRGCFGGLSVMSQFGPATRCNS